MTDHRQSAGAAETIVGTPFGEVFPRCRAKLVELRGLLRGEQPLDLLVSAVAHEARQLGD